MLDFVVDPIAAVATPGSHIADLFSGTGSVTGELIRRGFRVSSVDHLALGATMTAAIALNRAEPTFERLGSSEAGESGYLAAIERLNRNPGTEGFVFSHYSPAAEHHKRMYFTAENAMRIDGIREEIDQMAPLLTAGERALLLSDLAKAASSVSNVAGTFGAYLKRWKQRALDPIQLVPYSFDESIVGQVGEVYCADVNDTMPAIDAEVVYADPPYTKRQYAAYYHVLETIVRNDSPALTGSTGLRYWQPHASDWCYKRRAPAALESLLGTVGSAHHFFLSYSSDGHIPHEQIVEILGRHGATEWYELESRRYRSSSLNQSSTNVIDRLYQVELGGC